MKDLKTGKVHSYGRHMQGWHGRKGPSGVNVDVELKEKRVADVSRSVVLTTQPIVPVTRGFEMQFNNCTTFAGDVWAQYTGEKLERDYTTLGITLWHAPMVLCDSMREANKRHRKVVVKSYEPEKSLLDKVLVALDELIDAPKKINKALNPYKPYLGR